MYSVSFTFDSDIYSAIADTAKNARHKLRNNLFNAITDGPAAKLFIRLISAEPGKPDYPINWTSLKQKRIVMMKLRLANQIPYPRSHKMAQGWGLVLNDITEGSGTIGVINKVPYTDYVQGENQQRYLYKWPLARQVIRDTSEEMQNEVANAWLKAVTIKR